MPEMNYITAAEFQMISRAVVLWYRYYGATPIVGRSATLCREALALFDEGVTTSEDIAAFLIQEYVADDSLIRGSSVNTRH